MDLEVSGASVPAVGEDLAACVAGLSRLPAFSSVPGDHLRRFVLAGTPVRLSPGRVLVRQDAPIPRGGGMAWLVVEGVLRAYVRGSGGEEPVGDVRPGEVVGELGLFANGGRRSATVRVEQPALCVRFDAAVLEALPHNRAVLALERHLMGSLARRIRKANLLIQKAWRESSADTPPEEPMRPGFLQRLAALFGGGR